MGHSFRFKEIKKTKFMDDPEYGNTEGFAARVLKSHWKEVHKGQSGTPLRPYECQVCRDLWLRTSLAIQKAEGKTDPPTPLPYMAVVQRVNGIVAGLAIKTSRQFASESRGKPPASRHPSPKKSPTSPKQQGRSPRSGQRPKSS